MSVGRPLAVLISPQFPPSALAGVHRARHLAKHLPSHGWHPVVMRVDEQFYIEPSDQALAALMPPDLEQVSVKAVPAKLGRTFGIGDVGLRCYPYLRAELDRLFEKQRPDVVFITGFPFYPMMLAGRVRRRYGVPVVLDFQDPWVSDHGASVSPMRKEGLAHQLAMMLEPRALRHASFVTSVSEAQNKAMAKRYPWLDASRMAAIPIGGDPEDFVRLAALPYTGEVRLDPDRINLSYVGAFLPRAGPLAQALLRSLALLRDRAPRLASRLRVNFIGSSNNPHGYEDFRVLPLARAEGVEDMVAEAPQRVPYMDALSLLSQSTGLLLIGSDEVHYTASKIYPALMSGRPYLSLFHSASSAHEILSRAGGGETFSFSTPEELSNLTADMTRGLIRLAEHPEGFGKAMPQAFQAYTAHSVAGDFAAVFDRVTERRR